jgi:hypothetical protein
MCNIIIIAGMKTIPIGVGFDAATIYAPALEANTWAKLNFTLNYNYYLNIGSRDSAVIIAPGYGVYDRGVGVPVLVESWTLFSSLRPDLFWDPPSLLSNGYPGVKRPGRESDHSSLSSAEVKKTWIYTSTPTYAFVAQCLIS